MSTPASVQPSDGPKLQRINLEPATFILINALIICVFFNRHLFSVIFNLDQTPGIQTAFFVLSSAFVVGVLSVFCLLPFYLINSLRSGAFFLFIVSAYANYFSTRYKIIADDTVFKSFFETTFAESSQFFNRDILFWSVLWTLVFLLFVLSLNLKSERFVRRLQVSGKTVLLCLLGMSVVAGFFYKDYASFLRNNRQVRHLVNPVGPIYQIGKYWKTRAFPKVHTFTPIGFDAKFNPKKSRLVVMILGETARSDHFSINGYKTNETTPQLKHLDVLNFPNVFSCGTATATSVPCIFSNLGQANFNSDMADARGNLLDVVNSAGYQVTWIDNNTGCQGVCDRIQQIDLSIYKNSKFCNGSTCYDEILLEALKSVVESEKNENQFVVLHMLGSHGPSYHLRVPETFKKFQPSCQTSDLSQCAKNEIINSYDNTILYTDHLIAKTIEYLKTLQDQRDTAMVYVSDHGESLGENGVYLHSLPYFIAPREQKEIPLLFWLSPDLRNSRHASSNFERLKTCTFNHDYIFSTVLGLLSISTREYNKTLDLFSAENHICGTNSVN